jgi:sulfotransferase family protein
MREEMQMNECSAELALVQNGREMLKELLDCFPCPRLEERYFRNLAQILKHRKALSPEGRVVIGIGSGRCGSTTLTRIFSTAAGCCATHENPPLVNWKPAPEQTAFHIRRVDILKRYYRVVFDAAHWWINLLPLLVDRYPELKVVALVRDTQTCVESFSRIRVSPTRHVENWQALGIPACRYSRWSATYPAYEVHTPDGARLGERQSELIRRYVEEYNARVAEVHLSDPDRVLVVATETLASAATQRRILGFAGCEGDLVSRTFNKDTTGDGASLDLIF